MKRLSLEALSRIMHGALLRRGMSVEHSQWVVSGLLGPSLRGVDTHGVNLFPLYIRELDGGRAQASPTFRWLRKTGATRLLHAGDALGLVAGTYASKEAVALAEEHGTGAVAVAHSNHFGAASVYTLQMARDDMIGLSFSHSDALVAPFNGKRPFFGTNPLSMAVRGAGKDMFCLDMATSQIAYSKVRQHRQQNLALQPGWVLTPDGRDAAGMENWEFGALQALGGYKGQGLAMMVEILCALLTGMPLDHQLSHLFEEPFDAPRKTGHLFLAIHIAAFRKPSTFRQGVSHLLKAVRAQEAVGNQPVLCPGDRERQTEARRRQKGIPLPQHIYEAFEKIRGE